MKKCNCLLIFDWGDTVMLDTSEKGPMYLWKEVKWVPGAEEALKSLSSSYLTCIATSAGHSGTDEMYLALKRVGAEKYFDFFYSSRQLGVSKPDPEFFRKVAEKAGFKPARCIMTGNSYEKDIIGAKKSGMKTIWLNPDKARNSHGPDADLIIDGMQDLVKGIELLTTDLLKS